MTGKRFKILCIDGGGIKGIFSASVLAKYEEIYGVKMTDYFDLIAGTSTGGIIALGASLGIPMSDIVKFYEEKGPAIFSCVDLPKTKLGKSLRELRMGIRQALIKSKYNSKNLESALREVFGDAVLKDSNNLLCIPSYKITTARNRIFKKDYGPYHTDNKLSYVDVALATAAAPTYFPIKEIENEQYIDGGLWALNPTIVALTEFARNFYNKIAPYDYDSVSILSISSCEKSIQDYARMKERSFYSWKDTLFDIYTNGQNQSANFFVEQIRPFLSFNVEIIRVANEPLSPNLSPYIEMDSASKDSMNLMKGLGSDTAIMQKDCVAKFFETKKTFNF